MRPCTFTKEKTRAGERSTEKERENSTHKKRLLEKRDSQINANKKQPTKTENRIAATPTTVILITNREGTLFGHEREKRLTATQVECNSAIAPKYGGK